MTEHIEGLDIEMDAIIYVGIEDIEAKRVNVRCPGCSREFDIDTWIDGGGYHQRSGGQTMYDCPDDQCDGRVVVMI